MGGSEIVIRVLAADDHAIVRDGITRLIRSQSDMELVAEACDGREAVEQSEITIPMSRSWICKRQI
jgi:DNA-binding NarL/FixJ family response regulator